MFKFVLSGSNVLSELIIDEKLNKCICDINQIAQCLSSILINSVQAMPDGGVIKIRAENADTIPDELKGDSYIIINISDSGDGIPPENLKRIFDPFFSTKEGCRGLGLTTVFFNS